MINDSLVNQKYSLIYALWGRRNRPEVRERIISLYREIEKETNDKEVARRARENIELLSREPQAGKDETTTTLQRAGNVSTVQEFESDFLLIEKPDVNFSKIGGLSNIKETLRMEVIEPRKQRHVFELYGRTPGMGILLWGPPGTGKTLLAKAVAGECDLPFIAPKKEEILSRWVGEQEKNVAATFKYARGFREGAVIFWDEIEDYVARSGPSYIARLRNIFRNEMDGIRSKNENILLLCASNHPWQMDPAIRRPKRLTKIILVPPPDENARLEIFRIHLNKIISKNMLSNDVDLNALAALTHAYSGADIEAICLEAIDIPLKEALKGNPPRQVTRDDFLKAISTRKPSITPWFVEASRAVKRYGEDEFASQIQELIKEFAL